jgi:hypothetical protein
VQLSFVASSQYQGYIDLVQKSILGRERERGNNFELFKFQGSTGLLKTGTYLITHTQRERERGNYFELFSTAFGTCPTASQILV